MSTFVLIHGGGDTGWSWRLVAGVLRAHGHDVIAPDLPGGDDTHVLEDYADAVLETVGEREDVVIVGHSFGAFTATLLASRLPARSLILLAGMIPAPGESPNQWWDGTGWEAAVTAQRAADGGLTGNDDPFLTFYHDVPTALAEAALAMEREHPSSTASAEPWPLDSWPTVPTRFIVCTHDRLFPAEFMRRVARERLGVEAEEIDGGHCVMLSRPAALAELLMRA